MIEKIIQRVHQEYKNVASVALLLYDIIDYAEELEVLVVVDDITPQLMAKNIEVNSNTVNLIIVSKNALTGDVYYDLLGGYLASKLTVFTRIIYDRGLWLRKVLEDYRYRIVLREIETLASYGEIIEYALVPYEYFPVKNLSIYAKINYNLAVMLVKAYNDLGEGLLERMSKEYESLIKNVVMRHKLKLIDKYIKLKPASIPKALFSKTSGFIKEIVIPLAHPLLDVIAGYRRSEKGPIQLPLCFDSPHILIEMELGKLALGDWHKVVKVLMGEYRRKIKRKSIYSIIDTAELHEYDKGIVVVKQYMGLPGVKWLLASLVASISKKFSVLPSERLLNEYKAVMELNKHNIPTRHVLIVDPISYTMVFEFIEGEPLSNFLSKESSITLRAYRLVGELLASIHGIGLTIGDTKPDNFIYNIKEDKIYPIDLEQAKKTDSIEEKAWDIAMFTYFHFHKPYKEVEIYLREFLTSYRDTMGSRPIKEATRAKYLIPFTSIAPIQQLIKLQNLMKEYAK